MISMNFRRAASTLLAVVGLSVTANAASPAQNLFDQAASYLELMYNGFSPVVIRDLTGKYRLELTQACANQVDTCPYPVAVGLIERMILEIGDKHTNYYSPDAYTAFQRSFSGQGAPTPRIGVVTRRVPGSTDRLVVDVVENGPAEAAGFLRGDRIVAVNGAALPSVNEALEENSPERQTQEQENSRAISKVVSTGEPVTLTVLRRGTDRLEVQVQGKVFASGRLPSLKTAPGLPAGVVVLRIPDFEGPTVGQVIHDLVLKAQQDGAKGIIVDLRENGGGRSTECLSGVGAFVGPVARVRESRKTKREMGYRAGVVYQRDLQGLEFPLYRLKTVASWQGPVVALVNTASGSCAEYFAADLQFAKRGVVLGEKTAGVGNTGTLILGLLDGSGLQVTTERAIHPDGTPYAEAVTPDIAVKDDLDELAKSGRDVPLERAVQALGL